jgi:hypothetical protein
MDEDKSVETVAVFLFVKTIEKPVKTDKLEPVTQEANRLKPGLPNGKIFAARDDGCYWRNGLLCSLADHKQRWSAALTG